MKLTDGALSMLLKRYRAVLFKCRSLNWLAGMVLAGGIVLGGVSGALAAATSPENLTWQSNSDITSYNPAYPDQYGNNVTINGGSAQLTITGYKEAGNLSIVNSNLTIGASAGTSAWDTVGLTGYGWLGDKAFANGTTSAGTSISGSNITIYNGSIDSGVSSKGEAAIVPGNFTFSIANSTINLAASSANYLKAVIIATNATTPVSPGQTMELVNSTVNVAAGKGGTIAATNGVLDLTSGSKLDVSGVLALAGGITKGATAAISATGQLLVNVESGSSINVNTGGNLIVPMATAASSGVVLTIGDGGALNVAGGLLSAAGSKPEDWLNPTSSTKLVDANTLNSSATSININGAGTLNVSKGGMIYLAEPGASSLGKKGAPLTIEGGTVEISGGPAENNGSNAGTGLKIFSRVWAGAVTINGGTVNIGNASGNGGDYARWSRNYLAGYGGLTINGGTINLLPGSEIQAAGNENSTGLAINGGTINLQGTGAPYYSYFFGNTTPTLPAGVTAYKDNGTANILFSSNADTDDGNRITGGTINVASGKHGSLIIGAGVTMSGGTINADGTLYIDNAAGYEQGPVQTIAAGDFKQTNGTVLVSGTLNIQGATKYTIGNTSANTASLSGTGTLQIAPAKTGYFVSSASSTPQDVAASEMVISGWGTVDFSAASAVVNNYGKITINDTNNSGGSYSNLKVNGLSGLLKTSTSQVLVTQGVLDLGNSSTPITLNTAGASANFAFGSSALDGKIVLNSNGQIKAGAVVLESGDAAFAFNQADTTLVARQSLGTSGTSKSIALSNGTIRLGSPQTTTGQLKTSVTVSSDGQLLVHGGTWTLGNNLTVDAGNGNNGVTIGNGSTKATLDISQAGAVVTSGTAYQPLKSGAAGDGTKGINVLNNGTLTALANQLTNVVTDDNGKVTSISALQTNLNTLYVGTGGTVSLGGIKEISTTNLTSLKTALFGTDAAGLHGTLDLGKVTISDISTAAGIDVSQAGQLAGLDLPDVNIVDTASTDATPALAGSFGTVTLKNAAATGVAVATGTTLELNGTSGQNLITAQASSAANKVGTLGVGADGGAILNQGVVGAVTLVAGSGSGTNTVLQVNGAETGAITAANNTAITLAGNSKVGNITGAATSSVVNVATGADAKAGEIGKTTGITSLNNSGTLNATSINTSTGVTNTGTLNSTGAIVAPTLEVNSGSVKATDITANTKMTVGNGAQVTSTGSGGITANAGLTSTGGTISAQKLTTSSGGVTMTGGKLDLNATGSNNSSISGGTLNLTNVLADVSNLTVSQAANISGGSFDGANVTLSGGGTFNGGASAVIEKLTGPSSGSIKVGTATGGSATLDVGQLILNGGNLLIDPDYDQAPSVVTVEKLTNVTTFTPAKEDMTATGGSVGIGRNSMLGVGASANQAWLEEQVAAVNGSAKLYGPAVAGKVGSVLGLYVPVAITNTKGILLDPDGRDATMSPSAGFTQKANTLLVVYGGANGVGYETGGTPGDGALTYLDGTSGFATTKATADINGASFLRVTGVEAGKSYRIIGEGFDTVTAGSAWDQANISSDNALIKLTLNETDNGTVDANRVSASTVMPKLAPSLSAMLDDALANDQIGTKDGQLSTPVKGVQFLSRVLSDEYLDAAANPDQATKTIEGAARMITIGAVPQMTRAANQAAAEAVTQRTSMAIPSSIKTQQASDNVALWVMPLYQSTNGSRLEAGKMDADYHGGLGGIALGADYTFANAIRAGIAFNIGAGYATGGGDFADTTNSMNFWGLGAYAGWTGNNIGVSGDINFTSAYNKLSQDLPQSMGMRDLKADVRSYAFSTGIRGEYKLATDVVDVTPHVGVRYMYLTTEDYDVKSQGTVLKGDGLNQNIWTFPIGVSLSKTIETASGWNVKPLLDLAVVPAAGDIKAKENVRFTGTDYKAELETQIMDYITYQGILGLEVNSGNMSFGVSGNAQFGEKTSGYGVLGTFRYEF